MSKFIGQDLTVTVDGTQIANGTSCILNISRRKLNTYDKTVGKDNQWRTSLSGSKQWSVTSSLNVDITKTVNAQRLVYAAIGNSETFLLIRFYNPDLNMYFEGYASVETPNMTGVIDNTATFSCVFQGEGPLWIFTPECPPYPNAWLQDPTGISWGVTAIDATITGDGSNDSSYLYWGALNNDYYDYDTRTVKITGDYDVDAGSVDLSIVYYSGGSWSSAQDTANITGSGTLGALTAAISEGSFVNSIGLIATSLSSNTLTISNLSTQIA